MLDSLSKWPKKYFCKMENCFEKCFVCGSKSKDLLTHKAVNLPVCLSCHGSKDEEKAIKELMDGLAEGFVCGCI